MFNSKMLTEAGDSVASLIYEKLSIAWGFIGPWLMFLPTHFCSYVGLCVHVYYPETYKEEVLEKNAYIKMKRYTAFCNIASHEKKNSIFLTSRANWMKFEQWQLSCTSNMIFGLPSSSLVSSFLLWTI